MHYVTPYEAVNRAKALLEALEPHKLFYAALELRLFVEARQTEYLQAQEQYRKSMPAAHKIGRQAAVLAGVFDSSKIQKLTWEFQDGWEFEFRYIPVCTALKTAAEKAGRYLHANQEEYSPEDILKLAGFLKSFYDMADHCLGGNLLSPMLVVNGSTVGGIQAVVPNEASKRLRELGQGEKFVCRVEYEDAPY